LGVEAVAQKAAPAPPVLAAALLLLGLTACATPVRLASSYAPRDASFADADHRIAAPRAPCRVLLAGVQDLRDDRQAAGVIGGRFVHADDALSWFRSGLKSISNDPRLDLGAQTPAGAADLVISADLLKLYMLPINEAKSATVVVKVHYGDPAGSDDQVYRGTYTSLNWADAQSETQGAFDNALRKVLSAVDRDLLSRCAARTTSGH
jgi:hypothetical protein